jgi:hypothetical protein
MAETDPISMPSVRTDGYALRDGMLQVPDSPGFGLEVDSSAFSEGEDGGQSWRVGQLSSP